MSNPNVKEVGFIKLPNDEKLVPALLQYTKGLGSIVGFSDKACNELELALEEACVEVIKNAFTPDEEATIDISFCQRLDGMEIHIHDMGLPYDPENVPAFDPTADLAEADLEGLGTFLVNKMVDEYRFQNLGIKGKEMVLTKYFDSPCVVDGAHEQVEPEVVEPPKKADVEPMEFDIRLMQPDEALEVCRCIYDCYGYSYANENVYYPERVVAMNQDGKLRSGVAVTQDGEIGGHFALIYYDSLPAEIGIAVTKKKFRGQGFARQLGEFLEAEAREDGLKGVQVKEVTAHPYTQKFCFKLGYSDCGMLLAHSPKSLSFKGIADQLKQRNSDVLGFKYLEEPGQKAIYAPARHREMICSLYRNLGVEVDCQAADDPQPVHDQTTMSVNVNSLRSLAEIGITDYGPDALLLMRQELHKLFKEEIQVFELFLNLEDPMTAVMVPEFEKLGFIFTGILPETLNGDSLVMQYFNGVHIDYNELVLVSETAKNLLEYIRRNDPHAG